MALSSVAALKILLGITDSSRDAVLTQLQLAAEAAVKTYLRRGRAKRAFTSWPESGSDTEFYSGNGQPDLILRYWPVTAVASVYLDAGGHYGDGTDAFAAATLLTAGSNYNLVRDDGTYSNSGLLRRLGGITAGGEEGWFPPYGDSGYRRGTLAGAFAASWPVGDGNIKVTYTAGYTTVPADLSAAVDKLAAWMYLNRKQVGALTGEALGAYNYTLAQQAVGGFPELGSVRGLLASYREVVL